MKQKRRSSSKSDIGTTASGVLMRGPKDKRSAFHLRRFRLDESAAQGTERSCKDIDEMRANIEKALWW